MKSKFLRLLFGVALLLNANSMSAQSAYCNSYEDFLKDNWIPLDTVNKEGPDNSQLWWWGGNSYKFSTGDKATDKILKKEAFMVKQNDTLYVNCRDLVFSDVRFGNGYAPTKKIGKSSLLFVNKRDIGKAQAVYGGGMAFGAIGGAIMGAANSQAAQLVCYVISSGKNNNGVIYARVLNDEMMDLLLSGHEDVKNEFYSEKNKRKRLWVSYVLPILEKAGIL